MRRIKIDCEGMMKQHIILEQLREIDSEIIAIELIRTEIIKHSSDELIRTEKFAKKMTIGKMIEILGDRLLMVTGAKGLKNRYSVEIHIDNYTDSIGWARENLCDALWAAVKEVLCKVKSN